MDINISSNLKRLRKKSGITQEDLANFIGVSYQAISKWERNEGYPDITILPVLANYFGVTIDEIIGMDEIKNAGKLEEIKAKHQALISSGRIKEDIALLRDAIQCFPNEYFLLAELACFLDGYGDGDEEISKNRNEAIKISERILEFCTDTEIRNNVQCNICFTLWRNGEKERAVSMAKKLPNLYKTSNMTLNNFLEGEEKVTACQETIQMLCWAFWAEIKQLAETSHYSYKEKIMLYKKAIDMYKTVYDCEDYHFTNIRLQETYDKMARLHYQNGNQEEAIDCIEKATDYAIAYSSLPNEIAHTSLLVNALKYEKANTSTNSQKNQAWHMRNNIDSQFSKITDNDRLRNVISKLDRYA